MSKDDFKPTKLSMITILLASMLMLMGGAAVAPALPSISVAFPDASESLISLIITFPSLAIAIVGLAIGALSDKVGKVKVLFVSLFIFGLAGVSAYFMDNIYAILAGRFFVGIGIAGIASCCTALLSEYYTGSMRVKALGYQSAAMGLGVLVLESAGGALADFSWRDPFLIYGLGFLILALALVSLREPSKQTHENADGIEIPPVAANKRLIAVSYITIFLGMIMCFMLPTKLPYYFSEMGSASVMCGLFLGIGGVCNTLTSLCYRTVSLHLDRYVIIAVSFTLLGAAFAVLYLPSSLVYAAIAVCLYGIGMGLVSPAVSTALATQTTPQTSGKIMGGYSTAFYLGQFSATLIIVPVLAYMGSYGGHVSVHGSCISDYRFGICTRVHFHKQVKVQCCRSFRLNLFKTSYFY